MDRKCRGQVLELVLRCEQLSSTQQARTFHQGVTVIMKGCNIFPFNLPVLFLQTAVQLLGH